MHPAIARFLQGHPAMTTPSILRANNPCALRPLARGRWKGQHGTIRTSGGLYCAFSEPVWGVRAALRNLDTYRRRHGLDTPAAIIARWAPAADRNPETAYARFIARRTGIRLHAPIPHDYEHTRRLVAAIVRFETGTDAIGPEVIAQAMALMAAEEEGAGRDPAPYLAPPEPLKPLTRSREIALGGGAATIGVGGTLATAPEIVDAARDAVATAQGGSASLPDTAILADYASIGSFVLLALFGLAIVANRLAARFRALR